MWTSTSSATARSRDETAAAFTNCGRLPTTVRTRTGESLRSVSWRAAQERSIGSGSIGRPPEYQPGAVQASKCRWHALAGPVSPTKPIGWPVHTRAPVATSGASRRCMYA